MTSQNWVEVVISVENNLGWLPRGRNVHQVRAGEASKLAKAAETNPKITYHNCDLAIALLRRRKQPVKSPLGITYFIDDALELAYTPPPVTDLAAAIRTALDTEKARADDESHLWIRRLVRAQGSGRATALEDWKAAGRE